MTLRRALLTWLSLAMLMSLNGIFREAVLVRRFGRRAADGLSAASGTALILGATGFSYRRSHTRRALRPAYVALLWGALTPGFEFSVGHFVDRKSWRELLENYAFWRGKLWPWILVCLAVSPFFWSRWSVRRR